MIPLLPILYEKGITCYTINIIDTTDYSVGSGQYDYEVFKNGLRIIKITAPDGTYKFYCTDTTVNPPAGAGNLNPVDLGIIALDTTITDANNTDAEWTFPMSSGTWLVEILIVPILFGSPEDYPGISIYAFQSNPNEWTLGYIVPDGINTQSFAANLNADLTLTGLSGGSHPGEVVSIPSYFINSLEIELDCSMTESIDCVFSKYQEAFCGNCGCEDICKNKKSNNILKATLLLRHLELVKDDYYKYNALLNKYEPIFSKLCHCS